MARYTFGDDDAAVRRMALVAEAYAPISRAFIGQHARIGAAWALDLGCGPGFSTALVAAACRPRRLTGLDSSPQFLRIARERVEDAHFEEHDVTRLPLPGSPADVIYARLVLAHLPDPVALITGWRGDLAHGGTLLSEELETVEAPAGPLRAYDEISAAIVQEGNGVMYAGPLLADLGGCCTRVTVDAQLAATIYLFNVRLWIETRADGEPEERLLDLERALVRIADGRDTRPVSWIVRQTVLRA